MSLKNGPGRPKIHNSDAERKRKKRRLIKEEGYKDIHLSLPGEYKKMFKYFCAEKELSYLEGICKLLDMHYKPKLNQ